MHKKINTHKQNNVITVTNNNVKYYENLANQYSKDAANSVVKSEFFASEAEEYLNSCKSLKDTLKQEVVQLVDEHSENNENPHGVTSAQVNAYSKTEMDSVLTAKLATKNPNLVAGQNIVIVANEDGTQTISSESTIITDYNTFTNKPSINNIILSGNKSSQDLGLALLSEIPVNVSDLQNDSGYLTAHQDISGKQDVLSAGDGILIQNNTISTVNRANTDLSNISDVGKKVIDGQWVSSYRELSTAIAQGTYTIDLSDYLPNDNCNYEILLNYYVHSTTNSGTGAELSSNFYNQGNIVLLRAASGAGTRKSGTITIVIDNTRSFNWILNVGKAESPTWLRVLAYRRIGTNI